MNSFVERTAIFYDGIRTPYHDRLMNANVVFNNNNSTEIQCRYANWDPKCTVPQVSQLVESPI